MFDIIGQWTVAYLLLGAFAAAALALHDQQGRGEHRGHRAIVFVLDMLIWPLALWAEFADWDDRGPR